MDVIKVFYSAQTIIAIIVTVLSFCTSGFLIVYLIKHLRIIYRQYKVYRNSFVVDCVVRAKMLFNYKTVIYKNGMLILILVLEVLFYFLFAICFETVRYIKRSVLKENITSLNCNITNSMIQVLYLKPLTILFPMTVVILLISLISLFSFLSTFLSRRYYGYSLDKRVISKYIVWWLLQIVLLLSCSVLYLQILFLFLTPILLFIDWCILLKESLKLSRHIKAVVFEVKQFENDPARYRAAHSSYRTYKFFIFIELLILILIVMMVTLILMDLVLQLVLTDNWYFKLVYDIDINFSNTESSSIYSTLKHSITIINTLLGVLYCGFIILPQCIIIIPWLVYVLYKRVTIRKYQIRFNYESFQPLLKAEH